MLLSIFMATCRAKNVIQFFDNLKQTAEDHSCFEVLVKLDEGSDELIKIVSQYAATSPFKIKYLVTPKLDGYYTLDVGYNELLKVADPTTYFCWLLTDEIRIETKGWDSILKQYINFYPDDIFRIKLSIFQSKNYYDFFECLPKPDNYAVTTRKWLEITGGWGHFWGPDSWHQCIDYYLGLCKNEQEPFGVWRSFPVFNIKIGGQEAGLGENDAGMEKRFYRITRGWNKHSTRKAQENFFKLAQRLNAHIVAKQHQLQQYYIEENIFKKTVTLFSMDKQAFGSYGYHVPGLRLQLNVGHKRLSFRRYVTSIPLVRRLIRLPSKAFKQQVKKYKATVFTSISNTKSLLRAMVALPRMLITSMKAKKTGSPVQNHFHAELKSTFAKKIYSYDGDSLKYIEE